MGELIEAVIGMITTLFEMLAEILSSFIPWFSGGTKGRTKSSNPLITFFKWGVVVVLAAMVVIFIF